MWDPITISVQDIAPVPHATTDNHAPTGIDVTLQAKTQERGLT